MYNNSTRHILFIFIFGNCQLSTEETEEKKWFRETEQLNTEFLNTLKRNCHLPSVPFDPNESLKRNCISVSVSKNAQRKLYTVYCIPNFGKNKTVNCNNCNELTEIFWHHPNSPKCRNMLFSIRIFTATLGGKNSLTKEKVFSNVAENEGQLRSTKKCLQVQFITKGHLHFCKCPLEFKRDLF